MVTPVSSDIEAQRSPSSLLLAPIIQGDELESIWSLAHWGKPLSQFSRATGLTVSVYSSKAQFQLGPFISGQIGAALHGTRLWSEDGLGKTLERQVVTRCLSEKTLVWERFLDTMVVAGLPAELEGKRIGVLVFGWVFDHFADTIECDRIARALGVPGNQFWLTVRNQAPVSREKFLIYADLLSTLTQSVLSQLFSLEKLQENARLKDQFLASVSHELKTPVTGVQLRVQMLRRRKNLTDDKSLSENLDAIERGMRTQTKLIDDLLDSSRLMTGKLRIDLADFDLRVALLAALDTIRASADAKSVGIQAVVPERSLPTLGDAVRIQQVVWNLLSNAVKFTPAGGVVRLTVIEDPRLYSIVVKDTGKGIESTFLPKVFDQFTQANLDPSNKGLGLGLSIARHIIELHGGTIEVQSEGLERGSTFIVRIPRPSGFQTPRPVS